MSELSPRQRVLKEKFTEAHGYWSELWDHVLALSPDFFDAYMHFSSVPWKNGMLAPKVKEFIDIAIDAATTHLYAPGTRVHIRHDLPPIRAPRAMRELAPVLAWPCGPPGAERRRGHTARATSLPALAVGNPRHCAA